MSTWSNMKRKQRMRETRKRNKHRMQLQREAFNKGITLQQLYRKLGEQW